MNKKTFYLTKDEFDALYQALCVKVLELEFGGIKPPKTKADSPSIFTKSPRGQLIVAKFIEYTGTTENLYFERRRRDLEKNEIVFFDEYVFYNCLFYVGYGLDKEDKFITDVQKTERNNFKRSALQKIETMAKNFFADHKITYTHKYSGKPQAATKEKKTEVIELGNGSHLKIFSDAIIKNGLEKFTVTPVHYYYSTKSEKGELYWCHAIFDFTEPVSQESTILEAKSKIPNLTGSQNTTYLARIVKEAPDDSILFSIRYIGTHEKICHNIFDNMRSYDNWAGGFLYHDDWTGEMRLSPCLLSFEKLTDQDTLGVLPHEQCLTLQEFWNNVFTKNAKKAIFEEYTKPYKK
jgi:hypothetical protein